MKIFRYAAGHIAGQTMTVGELKNKLEEYPEDMPVFAEWEGCNAFIEPDFFQTMNISKARKEDECECLVIDVNYY